MPDYKFTVDWVSHLTHKWVKLFAGLVGRPYVRMLEVGSHEGRSAIWFLENILTHDTAHLTCVDYWLSSPMHERAFDSNIALSGQSHRVLKCKDKSRRVLGGLPDEHFDAVYIDGSHHGADALLDGLLALPLLKRGGLILFDDYEWLDPYGKHRHLPKAGIDAFLELCSEHLEDVCRGYQVSAKKS